MSSIVLSILYVLTHLICEAIIFLPVLHRRKLMFNACITLRVTGRGRIDPAHSLFSIACMGFDLCPFLLLIFKWNWFSQTYRRMHGSVRKCDSELKCTQKLEEPISLSCLFCCSRVALKNMRAYFLGFSGSVLSLPSCTYTHSFTHPRPPAPILLSETSLSLSFYLDLLFLCLCCLCPAQFWLSA